jgi:hypothetical protein
VRHDTGPVVDLGACEGCGLGCAVACAATRPGVAAEARRLLIATGAALVVLALVPASAGRVWLTAAALFLAGLGAAVSVLAWLARRVAPGAGDRLARAAYRLLPVAVGGLLLAWIAMGATLVMG